MIGLAVALACGYVIGFRFYRGPWYAVVFCLLTLLVGVALALLGDTLGTRSGIRPQPRSGCCCRS